MSSERFDLSPVQGFSTGVSLRWVLHHLMDHEAPHKGQILMLKRLLG